VSTTSQEVILLNAFHRLRQDCLARSTRPFLARGKSVQRCDLCQLARQACICPWRAEMTAPVDFVLLLHHDEVFKPTNTGRLIADLFPSQTYAFEWSRTEPPEELLHLLAEPQRYPVIVFPADGESEREVYRDTPPPLDERRLTFLLLDGTWRQASRMFRASPWLANLPVFTFATAREGQYAVRQAIREGQLATAEAAAELLRLCGGERAGQTLTDYFAVFNEHYLATRGSRPARMLDAHVRLGAGGEYLGKNVAALEKLK